MEKSSANENPIHISPDFASKCLTALLTGVMLIVNTVAAFSAQPPTAADIRVLFLGGPVDPGGCCHIPYPRYTRLQSEMAKVGIRVDYAPGRVEQRDHVGLTDDSLKNYDVIFTYNTCNVEPVMDPIYRFVESGKGLVAVHVSIINGGARWYKLLGAQFSEHGWGDPIKLSYRNESHGAMQGVPAVIPFKDETYHFWNFTNDRTILEKLDDGGEVTWVRKQGLGTVYYTGMGHQFPADSVGVWETWEFMKKMEVAIKWVHSQNPRPSTGVHAAARSIDADRKDFMRIVSGRFKLFGSPDAPGGFRLFDIGGRESRMALPPSGGE